MRCSHGPPTRWATLKARVQAPLCPGIGAWTPQAISVNPSPSLHKAWFLAACRWSPLNCKVPSVSNCRTSVLGNVCAASSEGTHLCRVSD